MVSNLRIETTVDDELQKLLAQQSQIQAQIQARLESIKPVSGSQHQRSPIHKQHHRRSNVPRSNVPRSMSSNGSSMARHLSSDSPQRMRTFSQQSAPSMARTSSTGQTSARSANLPFTQTGAVPPPLVRARPQTFDIDSWTGQEQDQSLNQYTYSNQTNSQRISDLERVPELGHVGLDPGTWLSHRDDAHSPAFSLTPSPNSHHRLSSINTHQTYEPFAPSTPTSDEQSLTTATTLASNSMSRQNSLYNEQVLQSMQMMKFTSNNSFSTDHHTDHMMYDAVHPRCSSSRHSKHSSNEEQSQLLVGAGGAGHDSHFSHSFSADEMTPFHPSSSYGETMQKSESNESNSSTSSSRNKQRLQTQIVHAASRPLMPKGGSDMSRDNSSHSMLRLESRDGSQDKIAISKPTYQRPKHDRVFCKLCDDHPEGFRGEHELRRHMDRQHKLMVKKWVCVVPPSGSDTPKPVVPLSKCKACAQQKKYGAYYNAAAHLRRAHFKPKSKGRSKGGKVDDVQKRGGNGGGDWPPMDQLKPWMMEVEEPAEATSTQQKEAEASDEEIENDTFDDSLAMNVTPTSAFEPAYMMPDSSYSYSPNNYTMSTMQYQLGAPQSFDSTLSCQTDFSSSSVSYPEPYDPLIFSATDPLGSFQPSLSSSQSFGDQLLVGQLDPEHVTFSYQDL